MDKMLKADIMMTCKRAMMEIMEVQDEVWVSADQLSKRISCFTKDWIKNYGKCLPRTRATVTLPDGSTHTTAYTYPLNRILTMVAKNEITNLKIK